jgi:hypothetical protein
VEKTGVRLSRAKQHHLVHSHPYILREAVPALVHEAHGMSEI